MEMQTETRFDKSKWPEGPWQDEPDVAWWTDEWTGYPCLAVRNYQLGNWCGYVGLAPDHPLYERPDHGPHTWLVRVHGGLTFAGSSREYDLINPFVKAEDLWWFGFDCAHYRDGLPRVPGGDPPWTAPETEYRTFEYVVEECTSLARQLETERILSKARRG